MSQREFLLGPLGDPGRGCPDYGLCRAVNAVFLWYYIPAEQGRPRNRGAGLKDHYLWAAAMASTFSAKSGRVP